MVRGETETNMGTGVVHVFMASDAVPWIGHVLLFDERVTLQPGVFRPSLLRAFVSGFRRRRVVQRLLQIRAIKEDVYVLCDFSDGAGIDATFAGLGV